MSVLQYIPESPSYGTILVADRCGRGWVGWEDSCYKLEAATPTDHTLASKQCNNQEAELYVSNSYNEADYVANYLNGKTIVGMTTGLSYNWPLIGDS